MIALPFKPLEPFEHVKHKGVRFLYTGSFVGGGMGQCYMLPNQELAKSRVERHTKWHCVGMWPQGVRASIRVRALRGRRHNSSASRTCAAGIFWRAVLGCVAAPRLSKFQPPICPARRIWGGGGGGAARGGGGGGGGGGGRRPPPTFPDPPPAASPVRC